MNDNTLISEIQSKLSILSDVILVNQNGNHDKYYAIYHNSNTNALDVEFGRIGNNPRGANYPLTKFDSASLIKNKLNKGYRIIYRNLNRKMVQGKEYIGNKKEKIIIDNDILDKFDKLFARLRDLHKINWTKEIKNNYIKTGKLSADQMIQMNKYYKEAKYEI